MRPPHILYFSSKMHSSLTVTVLCQLLQYYMICVSISKAKGELCQFPYSGDEVYPPHAATTEVNDDTTTPLYFGLVVGPGGSVAGTVNSSLVLAVRQSVDDVNAHPNLMEGYSLHYALTYSNVSSYSYV